jgi:hypothetical protein
MQWLEQHPVLTSIAILVIGYLIQALYTKWKVTALTEWQKSVDDKLRSIDTEMIQIKVSAAREGAKMESVTSELTRQTNDLVHMRARLDDVHGLLIMALSGGKIGETVKPKE